MDRTSESILSSLLNSGSADEKEQKRILVNKNPESVLDKSSGKARLRKGIPWSLVSRRPLGVEVLQCRCILCGRVLQGSFWVAFKEFKVNIFYYFLCQDAIENGKVKESH